MGLGDVLEHSFWNHRGHSSDPGALCRLLCAARRDGHPRAGRRRGIAAIGHQLLGGQTGSSLQLTLTIAKVAAIVVMVFLFFWFGGPAHRGFASQTLAQDQIPFHSYGLAIAAGLFAFGGWHMVTYAAGETREAARTIPHALLLGALIVTACYIILNVGYLYVLPINEVAHSTRVAAEATERVLGRGGGGAIADS